MYLCFEIIYIKNNGVCSIYDVRIIKNRGT